jgi:hypothetical protein
MSAAVEGDRRHSGGIGFSLLIMIGTLDFDNDQTFY